MFISGVAEKLRILFSRREKFILLGVVALMTLGAMMEIAGLGLLMPLVALFTKPELLEQNRYLRLLASLPCFADRRVFLIAMCGAAAGVYALKTALAFYIIRVQSRFISRKQEYLCGRLYAAVLNSPYEFHLSHGSGELVAMMSRAVELGTELLFPVMLLMTDLVTVMFMSLALLFLMPGVTLSCVLFLAVLVAAIYFPLRRMNARVGREQAEAELESGRRMLEGFFGNKAARAMGRGSFFISAYDRSLARWLPLRAKLFELGQLPRLLLELAAIVAALGLLVVMAMSGMSSGTLLLSFSLLIAALARMLPAFSRIHYNLVRVVQHRYSFDSVFEWLNLPAEDLHGNGIPLTLNDRIEVRSVEFSYPGCGKPLFRDFSITIPVRSSVALTGVTGGGKSTLVDIIMGLLKPRHGGVFADGRSIFENLESWRERIGFVPQNIYLLDGTVSANVAFGIPGEAVDAAKVRAALEMAQLWEFVSSLPAGTETMIGENGVRLSGGQRQRLGIARALYGDPELLIMDEATSALDNETEQALVDALDSLHGKLTIITIAHRLSTVARCDFRICVGPRGDQS